MRVMDRESRLRRSVLAGLAVALIGSVLAVAGAGVAAGQEGEDCPVTSMGTLGAPTSSSLQVQGHWSTEDCESRFRPGSDAHTYRFEIRSPGRVRIELTSAEADPYLYLLAEDGTRLADNDDGGAGLAARVERDLAPGVYLVEATTVGGRGRGAADFTLTVGRVAGCDIVHLGTLEPDADLTASGSWSLDTCGSRIVTSHPAYNYSFVLPVDGRVRFDLVSESGDPVLSLASLDGVIGANDDGGEARNSRIEQYLPAGVYFLEATTYLTRDLQPLDADFTLTVHLVDEVARQQQDFRIKVEKAHIPGEVVAGDPLTVNYRVGNAGGGDLPGGNATFVYVVGRDGDGRRVIDVNAPVLRRWPGGVSYHSDADLASATSVPNPGLMPLEVTFGTAGPAWLFVGAVTEDAEENELGFHGSWHNLMVLSGPTFDPVEVEVDGTAYQVSAEADDEGTVTTSVTPVADPEATVDAVTRAKAIYTAGVRTQLLDGIFERPALAGMSTAAEPQANPVVALPEDPSSGSLLKTFGMAYAALIGSSAPAGSVAAGEAINPVAAEDLVLAVAARASGRFTSLASHWRERQEVATLHNVLTFAQAVAVQAELTYAEAVLAPVATSGRIVTAAREAQTGWDDPGVRAMIAELGSCGGEADLAGALAAAGQANVTELVALDVEMRAALPVWGPTVDSALCGAAAADAATARFLERLALEESQELRELLISEEPAPEPEPPTYRLRVIARLVDDGRIEVGAELVGGFQILPDVRYLRADAPAGAWRESSDVELGDDVLGRIRARRLSDGRIEMGFVAGGAEVHPDIRYLPADLPEGIWFRSGEIKVSGGSG